MNDTSRRRFLGVAAAGAAVAGATAVIPRATLAGETPRRARSTTESVVAYVSDARGSELTLLVGEQEVVVHDRDLVYRLLNAAGR
ncbi:MAG TPA: twin-arginine translocation signal domain-containing protein [Actinomycetales bacterium]|jgi:hypothetical protein|nr:twin-arginine translocation signal domain-containing protein [Actinomycetales bacterium]